MFHETWEPASWSTLIYMSLPRATSSALASDPVPSSSGSPLHGADADDDGGWSDGSLDESEDSHLEDGSEPEPEWSSHLPTVAELLGHDSLEALHQNGGSLAPEWWQAHSTSDRPRSAHRAELRRVEQPGDRRSNVTVT